MGIRASDVAAYLGEELCGEDILISRPCSINNICDNGLLFLNSYSEYIVELLSKRIDVVAIASTRFEGNLKCTYILSDNPRLDFARILNHFFMVRNAPRIASTAKLGNNVKLGVDVTIGEYSVIGDNVSIGDNTEIRHHVVISNNTVIGSDCLIKSHTIIGEEGFGFERDEAGVPLRIPHLGRVVIGNNIEIGASVVIARGTIDDTIIGDNVKIDDQAFIAHNVHVGRNTMIIANAEVSGSSRIGDNCWLGPSCSVINGISIGDDCYVGLGSVVVESLPDNIVAAGCPARILRNYK